MTFTRRILPVGTALALVLTACGGSDSSDDETTETVVATEAEPESTEVFTENTENSETTDAAPAESAPAETAAAETAPAEDTDAETPPAETTPPDASGEIVPTPEGEVGTPAEGVAVSMIEWAIQAPTEYTAGDVTFTATNNGSFPHELVVIAGESYESLPLAETGSVIEDELPTGALLGRTTRIGGGASEDLTVTLAPGNYVLLCNLGGAGASHAGRGQRLDIAVS